MVHAVLGDQGVIHRNRRDGDAVMLTQRASVLLKLLVSRYIQDGQPVGSKLLAEMGPLRVSPATIRHVLVELEEAGYVASPHTSAGRIPTVQGLRYFVDALMEDKATASQTLSHLVESQLDLRQPTTTLVTAASDMLSRMTQWVGVVTVPGCTRLILRHLEFLPLSDNRVLAILVINQEEVQNRIIYTDRAYTEVELRNAAAFLLEHFCGQDLCTARDALLLALKETKIAMNRSMETIIDVAEKTFMPREASMEDCILTGEASFIRESRNTGIQLEDLQNLFAMFQKKQQMLHILDACLCTEGVQIFIGEESGFEALKFCSLVTSRYEVAGRGVGVLGVIGPTRMHYAHIIPIVEATAKLLSHALNRTSTPP